MSALSWRTSERCKPGRSGNYLSVLQQYRGGKKSGVKPWVWIAAGIPVLLVTCCGFFGIIGALVNETPDRNEESTKGGIVDNQTSQSQSSTQNAPPRNRSTGVNTTNQMSTRYDFSNVDYSIPKYDYSKGPNGESLTQNDGNDGTTRRPVTVQGFANADGTFVLHGLVTIWNEKPDKGNAGKKRNDSYWYNGQKTGPVKEWDEEGRLGSDGFRKNGQMHGKWVFYHENGKVFRTKWFFEGQAHGTDVEWHEGGEKAEETTWVNGAKHGQEIAWAPNGTKIVEGTWVNGKQQGEWLEWWSDGTPRLQQNFVDGLCDGARIEWDKNNRKTITRWRNGLLAGSRNLAGKSQAYINGYRQAQETALGMVTTLKNVPPQAGRAEVISDFGGSHMQAYIAARSALGEDADETQFQKGFADAIRDAITNQ